MADDRDLEPDLETARRLRDLALEYAARGHAAVAALVAAFESQASTLTADLGELVVNDEDDERLVLTAHGRFTGQVLMNDPKPRWETLDSPDDVAEHYDPVDLFADVADAIAEAYPGVDDDDLPSDAPDVAPPPSADEVRPTPRPASSAVAPVPDEADDEASGGAAAAPESATLRVLENLHAAGVLSDADFEAKKAELHQ